MRKPRNRFHTRNPQIGFSLVELLVALLFTSILMAGLATVFKSSLSTFVSSGEQLSSARRNRMALDLLSDDLNMTGQYLYQMTSYPNWITELAPGFWINPGANATTPDELYLSFDEALPFEGTLDVAGVGAGEATLGNDDLINTGADLSKSTGYAKAFTINVRPEVAKHVKSGDFVVFKDSFDAKEIATATPSASSVAVTIKESTADAAGNDTGSTGIYASRKHFNGTAVMLVRPRQGVRYSIQNMSFDPEAPGATVPCLIREQVNFGNAFASASPGYSMSVIAENVSNLKVSLSVDSGTNWITGATWGAYKANLNTALAGGRPGFQSITNVPNWYREIPTLVRVDMTTRTARARGEYSATGQTLAFKEKSQTLVVLPRYFGLSYFP